VGSYLLHVVAEELLFLVEVGQGREGLGSPKLALAGNGAVGVVFLHTTDVL
jgi:hypothetical protein